VSSSVDRADVSHGYLAGLSFGHEICRSDWRERLAPGALHGGVSELAVVKPGEMGIDGPGAEAADHGGIGTCSR
jgi:hypothetical protein